MLRVRARDNSCFVALCNAVGGQDELIFDGHSVVIDDEGEVRRARAELRGGAARRRPRPGRRGRPPAAGRAPPLAGARPRHRSRPRRSSCAAPREQAAPRPERSRRCSTTSSRCACALELGLRDYVTQERLRRRRDRALRRHRLGADGGARASRRSAPSGCTASRCRRATRRTGRAATRRGSPSRSGSTSARSRSSRWSRRSPPRSRRRSTGREPDLTEENLQARIRGTLLMALSNKFGWLVIATGNKSELSVGYSTLYGDLAGGFALLKDVYKTDVFRLARRLNERAGRELIPRRSSSARRAPSCAPTSSTRTRCRPTPSSTRCSRPTSSSTARARSCRRTASTRASSSVRSR